MSKRILIVCQHFWPESFRINDIATFLAKEKNCTIDVLCGIPNYPSGKFTDGYGFFKKRHQIHDGITIHRAFEIPRGNNSNLRIFLNYISFPITSLFHIPRLLTQDYDKIFIYQLSPVMMSITGILVGKIKKIETTMYVLDLWPENLYSVLKIKNSLFRKLAMHVSHWHYRHVDKLIALSESMKQRLTEVTRLPSNKIIVLPQSSEKIYETPIYDERLHRRFRGKFTIVFTGNISPAQSFDTIIEAAAILKEDKLDTIHWIIVGDGMSRKSLEKTVIERGLAKSFSFEGHHPMEDIPKYTERADLLVACLAKSELLEATIPAKVMSYIAAAKPIVLAMDGEAQKLINDQIRCGYAGGAGSATDLARNIKKVYSLSVKQRQRLGNNAKEYHFAHLERNHILTRLHDFIFNPNKV